MLPYPFSYFSSIWGFRKPLSKRFGLNWFQLLFTSIFLISLSMIPIAIQNSSQETYPLDTFIDNVYTPLTDEAIMDLSENAQIIDGKLNYSGTKNQQPSLLIGPSQSKEFPKDLQLHFDTEELVISKESKELTRIRYHAIQTESFQSKEDLTQAISKDWYQQNRVYISLFLVLGASFLFGLNFFIVSLGASLLLYITKKSRLFSFRSFKECYHFILNCLGLPTLITLILGLFGQNMATLITVQTFFLFFIWSPFFTRHTSVIQIIINRRFLCPLRLKTWPRQQVSHLQLLPALFKTNQRLVMKPKNEFARR